MQEFRVMPVAGGDLYKVLVTGRSGGLSVVAGFRSKAEALAWVARKQAADDTRNRAETPDALGN
jgi:hypothetical protein